MLSIDLSNETIRVLELSAMGGGIKVKKYFTVQAPAASITKGAITNLPALSEALSAGLKSNHVRSQPAVVAVNQAVTLFKEMVVPAAPEKQLRRLLQMEVEQSMGMAEDYLLDYILLEQLVQDQNAYKLLIVLMQKAVAADCKSLLLSCGCKPKGLTVAPIALFSAVNADAKYDQNAFILIQVIEDEASFLLIEKGKSLFPKTVAFGQKKAPETNEFILSSIEDVQQDVVSERLVWTITENISKFCQYQATKNKANPVKCAYVSGIDQPDMLAQINVNSSVEVFPMKDFSFVTVQEPQQMQAYTVAVGAALSVL